SPPPPSQLNESGATTASPEVDTEGTCPAPPDCGPGRLLQPGSRRTSGPPSRATAGWRWPTPRPSPSPQPSDPDDRDARGDQRHRQRSPPGRRSPHRRSAADRTRCSPPTLDRRPAPFSARGPGLPALPTTATPPAKTPAPATEPPAEVTPKGVVYEITTSTSIFAI